MSNPRYSHKVRQLWSDEEKFRAWAMIEARALDGLVGAARITDAVQRDNTKSLAQKMYNISFDDCFSDVVCQYEKSTTHDFEAFLRAIVHVTPAEDHRWLHYGLTSSDIVDTALYHTIRSSLSYVIGCVVSLVGRLRAMPESIPIVARTHGKRAMQSTSGHFWSVFAESLSFATRNLEIQSDSLRIGKLRGPVGCGGLYPEAAERIALELLGLQPSPTCTQILPRIRIGTALVHIEELMLLVRKMSVDLRLMLMDGIDAAAQARKSGYVGSSSMPHKNNPTELERISGLCLVVVANCRTVRDVSSSGWLYRDMSNSSVERLLLPDIFELCCFVLSQMCDLLEQINLVPQVYLSSNKSFTDRIVQTGDRMLARANHEDDIEVSSYDMMSAGG